MGFNVAIDGPAGSGKSTAAKTAANRLSFIYVDTGALYRAVGLDMLRRNIDPADEAAVSAAVISSDVTLRYIDGKQSVLLNGEDVSTEIRTEQGGWTASLVSRYKAVRDHLRSLQQKLAAEEDVLMDGRDIGTCILPHADVKIFLTADASVRADRRCSELAAKGLPADHDEIMRQIIERDEQDMNRKESPLKKAEDAILLDTSSMNIDQVVDSIVSIVRAKQEEEQK